MNQDTILLIFGAITLVVVLVALFFKIKKALLKLLNSALITQLNFIRMYTKNDIQKKLYNRSTDEAIEIGQDILWKTTKSFHDKMQNFVIQKAQISHDDLDLINDAIKIVRVAEAMFFIKKHGPLYKK